MSRHSEDRLANRAVAMARIAASEKNATVSTATATARFLAVGGAHVIVTRDAAADMTRRWYRAACESCGSLDAVSSDDAIPNRSAQVHAETCRRIPERLWPKGGA
ncbi:hypothetical protein Caci_2885 [Catenulispora acidiphila DSM 44928]|uniref:Uncharacterized protein n=1 Tax=Catenulispora acidiphila (strain DSM 44928 / JCM 14897 / NBRC 102108 / NRRL B-24433 / ID139908) TaxID=479433 RepID=C7Q2Q2_CATAD|nr:hypothetical protein [Catenulispora acidiphila]ACU71794.1 hypothetical protein Caci_2885 [Catenulispora acidiphila DSM 44928]